ncbi:phosphoribosyl-ATP diphosphatase, partial [Candidatus Magnetaquicoccus inordinatus]|uniref:phosphoribosyl-ATP diphosphatase n=1 Tax=Candidatus Magnetaquicoccus inordinatus TaxID=2496818 RepID=UPI001D0E844F
SPERLLTDLQQRLQQRRHADPAHSYAARLLQGDENRLLQKIGEEAIETLLAGKTGSSPALIQEMADLWFHCLLLLCKHNLTVQDILDELSRRFNQNQE